MEINEIYVIIDDDGDICAKYSPYAQAFMPMFVSKKEQLPMLRETMEEVKQTGKKNVHIYRFSNKELID